MLSRSLGTNLVVLGIIVVRRGFSLWRRAISEIDVNSSTDGYGISITEIQSRCNELALWQQLLGLGCRQSLGLLPFLFLVGAAFPITIATIIAALVATTNLICLELHEELSGFLLGTSSLGLHASFHERQAEESLLFVALLIVILLCIGQNSPSLVEHRCTTFLITAICVETIHSGVHLIAKILALLNLSRKGAASIGVHILTPSKLLLGPFGCVLVPQAHTLLHTFHFFLLFQFTDKVGVLVGCSFFLCLLTTLPLLLANLAILFRLDLVHVVPFLFFIEHEGAHLSQLTMTFLVLLQTDTIASQIIVQCRHCVVVIGIDICIGATLAHQLSALAAGNVLLTFGASLFQCVGNLLLKVGGGFEFAHQIFPINVHSVLGTEVQRLGLPILLHNARPALDIARSLFVVHLARCSFGYNLGHRCLGGFQYLFAAIIIATIA